MSEKINEYYLYFVFYSVIGWIYETFLEVVVYRWGFSPREYLFGPYCPIYGFGAVLFLLTVYPVVKGKRDVGHILLAFFLCMILATAVELLSSYISEWITGSWSWQTYSSYRWNFQARIALSPSIRFGLGGVFFLYVLQPLFEKCTQKLGKRIKPTALIIGILMLADLVATIIIHIK